MVPGGGLCSEILGLYDLTQGGENGLGAERGAGVCLEPRVSGEGGERLYQALPVCLSLSLDFPQSLQAKTKMASPSWGPVRTTGPNLKKKIPG